MAQVNPVNYRTSHVIIGGNFKMSPRTPPDWIGYHGAGEVLHVADKPIEAFAPRLFRHGASRSDRENSQNVAQAAQGAQETADNVAGLREGAESTTAGAEQVKSAAESLANRAQTLRSAVDTYIADIAV
jgi:hypothetical protein